MTVDATSDPTVIECDDLDDHQRPLRQGDVIEWLEADQSDPWRRWAIIVTADCDLAHQKHGGLLACVPVIAHTDYLSSFSLPARIERVRKRTLEEACGIARKLQESNRPDFPEPFSESAIADWFASASEEELVTTLRAEGSKGEERLRAVARALRACNDAHATSDFQGKLDLLSLAIDSVDGQKETRRRKLAGEAIETLSNLPGDAIFLHALSTSRRDGYVAYLRAIRNVEDGTVALRATDLRNGNVLAQRISRLRSPYVFHLTQSLGQVFSAIGLPADYDDCRRSFIAAHVDAYSGGL